MTTDPNRGLPPGTWWKLLVVAACALAIVVIGSGLGVEAWFVGLFLVTLAGVCAAAGVVLALFHLVRRDLTAGPR